MILQRQQSSDQGTPGDLDIGFATIELPWKNNAPDVSCIPAGEYDLEYYLSAKLGHTLHVLNVPDREMILMHIGNWAGDSSKGFKTYSDGCIMVGTSHGILDGQEAVIVSKDAVEKLVNMFRNGSLTPKLIIRDFVS